MTVQEIVAKRYTLTYSISEFDSFNNKSLKRIKVDHLSLNILLVWIGRHVIHDHHYKSKYFGGKQIAFEYLFWFKLKSDCDQARDFINNIIENGFPKSRY